MSNRAAERLARDAGKDSAHYRNCLANQSVILGMMGRDEEAETLKERTLADMERSDPGRMDTCSARLNLASAKAGRGLHAEAVALLTLNLAYVEKLGLSSSCALLTGVHQGLATSLLALRRFDEAAPLYEKATVSKVYTHGANASEVASLLIGHGCCLQYMGRLRESEAKLAEAVRIYRMVLGPGNDVTRKVERSLQSVREMIAETTGTAQSS